MVSWDYFVVLPFFLCISNCPTRICKPTDKNIISAILGCYIVL